MKACAADAVVIGGGPVGLLLAGLLGAAGRRVVLLEAATNLPTRSMAIGITPPSLDILALTGDSSRFVDNGLPVRTALVRERGRIAGRVQFGGLPAPFNFILTLPQADTVRLLHAGLCSMPGVRAFYGWRATDARQDENRVTVTASHIETGNVMPVTATTAAACDGAHGTVREWLGIKTSRRDYSPLFRMADYTDASGLGAEACLFFGPERPVESFPLPGGRRRWIVRSGLRGRVDLNEPSEAAIERLTGVRLAPEEARNISEFRPRFALARRLYRGRVALCGDAAHVMSPIGGQGMNTGFGDAACLARAIVAVLDGALTPDAAFKQYERRRRKVFRTAARRSALGMILGTARGAAASRLRGSLIAALLKHGTTHRFVARWFAMLNLPQPPRYRHENEII